MDAQYTSVVETLEPTKLKLTITIGKEALRKGLQEAYNKNKHQYSLQGFRKGKVPRKMLEQAYGRSIFHDDALNTVMPEAYEAALTEHSIEPVYRPEVALVSIDENEGAVFTATIDIKPVVEVEDYHGFVYSKAESEATEDEIQEALLAEQKKSATQSSVDRPAEMEDIVTINFKGYFGDEPFEGGEGSDHELTLGSGQFIDTFEAQLVGHVPGDDVTVNVTFPEEYHHPDYAGKEARFEVEILDVQGKTLPEIDDDFAANVSEFDTLEEYRKSLADTIKANKEQSIESTKRIQVMRQLVDKAKMDVPEAMYLARLDEMMEEFARHIQSQGMNLETYLRFTQLTPEALKQGWKPQAETDVKNMLALEAVAVKEGFEVTDEEFQTRLGEMTGMEGDALVNIIKELHSSRRKELTLSMLCSKAMDFVLEKAIATDEPIPELSVDQLSDTVENE